MTTHILHVKKANYQKKANLAALRALRQRMLEAKSTDAEYIWHDLFSSLRGPDNSSLTHHKEILTGRIRALFYGIKVSTNNSQMLIRTGSFVSPFVWEGFLDELKNLRDIAYHHRSHYLAHVRTGLEALEILGLLSKKEFQFLYNLSKVSSRVEAEEVKNFYPEFFSDSKK